MFDHARTMKMPVQEQPEAAGIRFARAGWDRGPTSEEESADEQDLVEQDAESVVGISMNPTLTRLASSGSREARQPIVSNQIDYEQPSITSAGTGIDAYHLDGTRDASDDVSSEEDSSVTREREAQRARQGPQPRLPSPWRSSPKESQKNGQSTITSLRDSLASRRRRALSGPSMVGAEALMKRFTSSIPKAPSLLSFTLPSLPFSLPFTQSEGAVTAKGETSFRVNGFSGFTHSIPLTRGAASYAQLPGAQELPAQVISSNDARPTGHIKGASSSSRSFPAPDGTSLPTLKLSSDTARNSAVGYQPVLRRSASDNSLMLYSTLSRVSSLGDDSRFEHVVEQANNRLRAIKDSWQDANFRLPSMPTRASLKASLLDSKRPFIDEKDFHGKEDPKSTGMRHPVPKIGDAIREPAAAMGKSPGSAHLHPYFLHALKDLKGDVVVMGGYRGSILKSAQPPHRQLWVPLKVGLNLRKVDLEVGLRPEDEETMEERIIAPRMLSHIGPVDISRRLLKRMRASDNAKSGKLRIWDYGYDWRLSPALLSRKFINFLEGLPSNADHVPHDERGAIVIAHSLGGMIARHAINSRPELVAGIIYAGVPMNAISILGPLRNGDSVMLSSRVLTAQVNFTIRTSFALLPLDGQCFVDKNTKEEYILDFFDPLTWVKYMLSPCVATPLPPLAVPTSGISGRLGSMLPKLPIPSRNRDQSNSDTSSKIDTAAKVQEAANTAEGGLQHKGVTPQMSGRPPAQPEATGPYNPFNSEYAAITISRADAIDYLTRTLAEVKRFKQELDYIPAHGVENRYPPAAVIYGKSSPTVSGVKVNGRDGIKRADAYDELTFASGDGVALARAAMLPEGYQVVRGGMVSSDRGHVTLLGDLEAVGRCLLAVTAGRKKGIGLGDESGSRSAGV